MDNDGIKSRPSIFDSEIIAFEIYNKCERVLTGVNRTVIIDYHVNEKNAELEFHLYRKRSLI